MSIDDIGKLKVGTLLSLIATKASLSEKAEKQYKAKSKGKDFRNATSADIDALAM